MLKKIIKFIGKGITVVSILCIIITMLRLDIDVSQVKNKTAFIIVFIISSTGIMGAEYIMGFAWKEMLDTFSGKRNYCVQAQKVYLKANIGKYLPGNVMHYVERNLFASNMGVKQSEVALTTFMEILGVVVMAAVLSILLAYSECVNVIRAVMNAIQIKSIIIAIVLLLTIAIVIIYLFRKSIVAFLNKYLGKKTIIVFFKVLPFYMLFLLIGALTFTSVLWCMAPSEMVLSNVYKIWTSYIIAWVIGFAVPGAPGGIGVREFVLLYLLNGVFLDEVVLAAVLIHRLITIAGDFLAYFTTLFLRRSNSV